MTYISKDLSRGKDEVLKSNITEDQFKTIKECIKHQILTVLNSARKDT